MRKKITLFTDGGCRGNPGVGGWACILKYNNENKEIYGSEKNTTNNRMELTAVIEGLKTLKESCDVTLVSDSKYICDGIDSWLENWIKNDWKTSSKKKPVLNTDLWKTLAILLKQHSVTCQWIKGHSGHPENELADRLANLAMDNATNNAVDKQNGK